MTQVYTNLENGLETIKKGLGLSDALDVSKIDDFQELTKGYIVLAHAQFEKYFETVGLSILKQSIDDFKSSKTVSSPLLSLTSSNIYTFTRPDNYDDIKHKDELDFDDRIQHFYNKYVLAVRGNNGIKSKDIFALLWTLGFSKDDIGEPLLAMLDILGTKRGKIAHTGNSFTTNLLNYEEEIKTVEQILVEVKRFDTIVENRAFIKDVFNVNQVETIIFS